MKRSQLKHPKRVKKGDDISGDGSDVEPVPVVENDDSSIMEMREHGTVVKPQRNGPLKIKGSFNDALRVLVGKKPKGPISAE